MSCGELDCSNYGSYDTYLKSTPSPKPVHGPSSEHYTSKNNLLY